jgi:hypothetical protein
MVDPIGNFHGCTPFAEYYRNDLTLHDQTGILLKIPKV